MKNLKSNLIIVLIVIISFPGSTQHLSPLTTIKKEKLKRACEFSLFLGSSFFGPADDIEEAVTAQSITTMPEDPTGTLQDPDFQTSPSYFFEFKYNLNQQSGISISRGTMDAFSLNPYGYAPKVKGGLKSTSLNYDHSIGHNRHEFSTGISFMSMHMKSTGNKDVVSGHDVVKKVGVNLGYAYHIIESKGFFLAFQAQYNWAGTAEIGPYSIYEPPYDLFVLLGTIHVPARNTDYPAVKVNLDSFNIGFTAGFRFGDVVSNWD